MPVGWGSTTSRMDLILWWGSGEASRDLEVWIADRGGRGVYVEVPAKDLAGFFWERGGDQIGIGVLRSVGKPGAGRWCPHTWKETSTEY